MKENTVPAAVQADPLANVTDLLVARVRATPELALFALPSADGGWVDVTAAEFLRQVVALAKGLVASGISPGDKIGLMCRTRYEWTLIDFATWFAGAVLVPIYDTSAPAQMQWELIDSGAVAIITETPDHFARFDEIRADVPLVASSWNITVGDLDKLVRLGVEISDDEIERRRQLATGSDLATLIYTSGTTGRPKGTILTHSNFVETVRNSAVAMPETVNEEASTLLFITMAHIFARFIAILSVHGGVRVGHQADSKQLLAAMGTFNPSFLLAVPRVFEKIYNSSEQKAESGGRGHIFRTAAAVAIAHSKALDAGKVPLTLALKFAVLDKLVLSKIRAAMGGRVKFAVSGSAPLGLRLGHFYRSLGIKILEGYGLTETTAPLTVNRASHFKIGTVGPPIPGASLRIRADGEIEARGVNVFTGYWNNPTATADSFIDGWFQTGDIGAFDDDGYLVITGRKKEIIVTASGKNVSPAGLEDPVRSNPIIAQVVVVGDRRQFISALITLDEDMYPVWLKNLGFDETLTPTEAATNPLIVNEVQRAIDAANATVSRAESIRKFVILPTDFSEASGHLTPKLSIKRNVILTDFADVIDGMYADSAQLHD